MGGVWAPSPPSKANAYECSEWKPGPGPVGAKRKGREHDARKEAPCQQFRKNVFVGHRWIVCRVLTDKTNRLFSAQNGLNRSMKKQVALHVVEAFGGGVFYSVAKLCHVLAAEVTPVVLHSMREETPADFAQHFPANTQFIAWSAQRSIHPIKDFTAWRQLRQVVRQVQPNLVHAHSSKAGALARLALPTGQVPVLYSPRAYGFLQQSLSPMKRCLYWGIEKLLGVLPHTTVACGAGEAAAARQVTSKIIKINNSIDISSFNKKIKAKYKENETLVVGQGRLSSQKNFPMFCAVAERFVADPTIRFVWLGGEPTHVVPSNVSITGWQDQAAVLQAMSKAQICLQTSLWEGLPRSVLEAMALRLPLVLSDIPGHQELIAGNGAVCRTCEDYVTAIHALRNQQAWHTASDASYQHGQNFYSDEVTTPQWRQLYQRIGKLR